MKLDATSVRLESSAVLATRRTGHAFRARLERNWARYAGIQSDHCCHDGLRAHVLHLRLRLRRVGVYAACSRHSRGAGWRAAETPTIDLELQATESTNRGAANAETLVEPMSPSPDTSPPPTHMSSACHMSELDAPSRTDT
jgi:hypothetical protein